MVADSQESIMVFISSISELPDQQINCQFNAAAFLLIIGKNFIVILSPVLGIIASSSAAIPPSRIVVFLMPLICPSFKISLVIPSFPASQSINEPFF